MEIFLSCDWGTTSCRLRLVAAAPLRILGEVMSETGIAAAFRQFSEQGHLDPESRISFYLSLLDHPLRRLEKQVNVTLEHIPLIISGMASASIGMFELPYQELPFPLDGTRGQYKTFPPRPGFPHPVTLLSGLKSTTDVMRGEETQLVGCAGEAVATDTTDLFIFPGTHSKHVLVSRGEIQRFQTYMTGEFFQLLSENSLLQASLEKPAPDSGIVFPEAFRSGVREARQGHLLGAAFRVRTRDLFHTAGKLENYYFLSGLLIGSELLDIKTIRPNRIRLIGSSSLIALYELALAEAGLAPLLQSNPPEWAGEAVVRGQYTIYKNLISRHESTFFLGKV